MKIVRLAGKYVNIDNLIFYDFYEDVDNGLVKCNYVFTDEIILQETYQDYEMFELQLENYGLKPIRTLKVLLNIIFTLLHLDNTKFSRMKTIKELKEKFTSKKLKRIK